MKKKTTQINGLLKNTVSRTPAIVSDWFLFSRRLVQSQYIFSAGSDHCLILADVLSQRDNTSVSIPRSFIYSTKQYYNKNP